MKRTYPMEELCCAHCAAKMEAAIRKLDGVNSVSINFLLQRITVDAEEARFEEIMRQAAAICQKIEPDCRICL